MLGFVPVIAWLALVLLLIVAVPARAQTYWRCVDAAGKLYLTEEAPPAGIRCVAQSTKELRDTPEPVQTLGTPTPGQHSLWITEPSGTILVRTYQTEDACRVALADRVAAAAARQPAIDVAYRCLPAGSRP